MTQIYISTDAAEAQAYLDPHMSGKYQFEDISIERGQELKREVGFNPMSRVMLNNISQRALEAITIQMIKEGFYVAVQDTGKPKLHEPADIESRDLLLEEWCAPSRKKPRNDISILFATNYPQRYHDIMRKRLLD